MLKWQDDPPRPAERPRPPATGHPDGDASRLWWQLVQAERTAALDWQRRAMLAEARCRELEALLEQQAALGGVRVRQPERRTATLQRRWDTVVLVVAVVGTLALVAAIVWATGGRFVGGGWS